MVKTVKQLGDQFWKAFSGRPVQSRGSAAVSGLDLGAQG
jgi:hypothetical protein